MLLIKLIFRDDCSHTLRCHDLELWLTLVRKLSIEFIIEYYLDEFHFY